MFWKSRIQSPEGDKNLRFCSSFSACGAAVEWNESRHDFVGGEEWALTWVQYVTQLSSLLTAHRRVKYDTEISHRHTYKFLKKYSFTFC
jgi:hypothetical protein